MQVLRLYSTCCIRFETTLLCRLDLFDHGMQFGDCILPTVFFFSVDWTCVIIVCSFGDSILPMVSITSILVSQWPYVPFHTFPYSPLCSSLVHHALFDVTTPDSYPTDTPTIKFQSVNLPPLATCPGAGDLSVRGVGMLSPLEDLLDRVFWIHQQKASEQWTGAIEQHWLSKKKLLSIRIHTHTNPWRRLKWLYAITRLTAHFMCGLMSDLVICKFRKSMAIHDTGCPYWDQVSCWRSGDNQSVGSSALVVSRWLWPGNRTFLEVASMVVTWWIVTFWCSARH